MSGAGRGRGWITLALLGALGVASSGVSCSESSPARTVDAGDPAAVSPYPADTALAVDALAIAESELDRWTSWVEQITPHYTRPHWQRLALTNYVLPLYAVRAQYAQAREQAASRAQAAARLEPADDEWQAHGGEFGQVEGDWRRLGLDLWGRARELEPGTWNGPFERVGQWALLRLEATPEARDDPRAESLRIAVVVFPYAVDPPLDEAAVEAAIDASKLTIVNPAWGKLVPEQWKYRMR